MYQKKPQTNKEMKTNKDLSSTRCCEASLKTLTRNQPNVASVEHGLKIHTKKIKSFRTKFRNIGKRSVNIQRKQGLNPYIDTKLDRIRIRQDCLEFSDNNNNKSNTQEGNLVGFNIISVICRRSGVPGGRY